MKNIDKFNEDIRSLSNNLDIPECVIKLAVDNAMDIYHNSEIHRFTIVDEHIEIPSYEKLYNKDMVERLLKYKKEI